jgi:hypothetical protein
MPIVQNSEGKMRTVKSIRYLLRPANKPYRIEFSCRNGYSQFGSFTLKAFMPSGVYITSWLDYDSFEELLQKKQFSTSELGIVNMPNGYNYEGYVWHYLENQMVRS